MPSDEEKERDGLERNFADSPPGPAGTDAAEEDSAVAPARGVAPGLPAEEPVTGAEKKDRKFWPLALMLTLFVLGSGGYYALTGMRQTAHQLGGGADYEQLSANSAVYDGTAGSARQLDVFAGGEGESPSSAAAGEAVGSRVNPALARTTEELIGAARGSAGGTGGASAAAAGGFREPGIQDQGQQAQFSQDGASMGEKLKSKGFTRGGAATAAASKSGAAGSAVAFTGSGAVVGKASVQSETAKAGTPKQAGKGSVMESLKGAFRATFYGARLASNDAARTWVARAFDASPEATTSIEYDEKMRAKLDKVNPNSIPQFLRDQDVTAAEARRLADSQVSKPKMDREGSEEALKADSNYQRKKMMQDYSGSMINGLFAGVSGTGSEAPPVQPSNEGGFGTMSTEDTGGGAGISSFADPEDVQSITDVALGDWLGTYGSGEECGCTKAAPCSCAPQATVENNCPMYGPFLPDDPCAF